MQNLTVAMGILAAALHGIAYIIYNRQAKSGKSQPNPVTWGIGASLAILNAASFSKMSGDVVMAFQFITGSAGSMLTFLYVLTIGKFSWPKPKEWALFFVALAAVFVWWRFQSAAGANMIFLSAFLIAAIPTIEGVVRDPFKESPRPWTIWTIAFFVTVTNIFLRGGKPIAFVTPIVLLFAHASVAFFSREKRKGKFLQAVQS